MNEKIKTCFIFVLVFFFYCITPAYKITRDILYVKQRLFDTLSMTVQIRVEISVPCLESLFRYKDFFFTNEHMFVCYVMHSLYVALFDIFNIYVYSFCVAYAYTGQQIDRGN